MSEHTREVIGAKLREARDYLQISQEEAAAAANIPRSAISLIESGQRKLDLVELMSLAKLYQRPMAYFTEESYSVAQDPGAAVFARKYSELSESDRKELTQFAEFLLMRKKSEK
jgi:transcriptional regulator with XRE-family HTH domain